MTEKRKVDEFLSYLRYEKRCSPHTLLAYQNDLNQFTEFLQERYQHDNLVDVNPMNVRSWVFELADLKLQRRTINRKISSLRSFFQFLMKRGSLDSNPASSIPQIKTGYRLPEVIPEEAIKNYFQFTGDESWNEKRDRMLISLLYETGIRRSELMELTWKDFDDQSGYVKVMGKRQKQRQIPIRRQLCLNLKAYRKSSLDHFNDLPSQIILTDRGSKAYPKWIYNRVKSILGMWANNERLSPHILRHSIATHLVDAGADIQVVREFLGHSTLAATQIYTHNSIGKLKNAYKKALPDLDAFINS